MITSESKTSCCFETLPNSYSVLNYVETQTHHMSRFLRSFCHAMPPSFAVSFCFEKSVILHGQVFHRSAFHNVITDGSSPSRFGNETAEVFFQLSGSAQFRVLFMWRIANVTFSRTTRRIRKGVARLSAHGSGGMSIKIDSRTTAARHRGKGDPADDHRGCEEWIDRA